MSAARGNLARRLKRSRRLQISLIILTIFTPLALLGLWLGREKAVASWYNDSWGYRNSIAISSHTSAESNVYISVTIDTSTSGQFQSDCGDLRFTDYAGNLLPYYIVSGCGTATTIIHVFFQSFPAGAQTIYYYYGNPAADNGFSSADFATEATGYVIGSTGSQEKGGAPVAYWKFDDGTGTNAQDSSPNNNDGTITGATWKQESDCISGKCLKFAGGSNDRVAAGTSNIIDITGDATYEAWVKITASTFPDATTNWTIFDNETWQSAGSEFRIDGATRKPYYRTDQAGASQGSYSNKQLNNNQWYHLAAVRSGTDVIFYIDGKDYGDSGTTHIAPVDSSNTFTIGSLVGGGQPFNGFMDETKIYNYARTAGQVKTDYASRGSSKGSSVIARSAATRQSDALSSGLVGYWKMDESAANSCTGGVNDSCDSSGNANNGAWQDNVTSSTGKFGNGTTFDGTNDNINVPTSTAINHTTNGTFSISIWVKPDTLTSAWRRGIIVQELYLNSGYRLGFDDGGAPRFWTNQSGGTLIMLSSTAMTINQWNHILVTYNNQQAYLYLNGIQVGNSTGTYIAGTNDFRIGAAVSEDYSGSLDETRIYNRALSPKEVRDLYNLAPGPVGYWNMDEKTGTNLYDTSGSGLNSSSFGGTSTWSTGKFGGALSFNKNAYVDMGDISSLDNMNQFTVEAWIKPTDLTTSPSNEVFISKVAGDCTGDGWRLEQFNNIFRITCGSVSTTSITLPDNNWHHVAFSTSNDGTNYTTTPYLDGVKRTATTHVVQSLSNALNLYFGSYTSGGYDYSYDGKLDEVKIYNYARTQKQIVEDMLGGGSVIASGARQSAVGYWKFDEGYGTNANNSGSQGTALNGTLTGMASPATATSGWTNSGKFGKGLVFDGTNDNISVPDSTAINFVSKPFTISVWAYKTGSYGGSFVRLVDKSQAGTANGYGFDISNSSLRLLGVSNLGVNYTMPTGSWVHLVAVADGTTGFIYANGILVGSGSYTTANAWTGPLHIGADSSSGSYYVGYLDEVKIYNYALTQDEVKTDYNHGQVLALGALGSNASYSSNANNQIYCIPGDASACTAPVGEWNFEEGSGASVYDSSGNGNTGTWAGTGTHYAPGKFGKGGKFNGSDDYLTAANSSSLNPSGSSVTVETWVNFSSALATDERIITKTGSNTGYTLRLTNTGGTQLQMYAGDGATYHYCAKDHGITTGTWNHMVGTYDGTNFNLYVNGLSIGSCTDSFTPSWGTNTLGIGEGAGTTLWSGKMDQVRVFNYARTPAQIAWDYNRGGPVGHWKFDECQGSTVNSSKSPLDSSSSPLPGTLTVGSGGTQTSAGNCSTSATTAWYSGRTGKYNSSLNFDGTDDYVSVANSTSLSPTSQITISAWIKPVACGNSGIVYKGAFNSAHGVYQVSLGNSCAIIFDLNGAAHRFVSSTGFTAGTWAHIVATYDGSSMKTFINGTQTSGTCSIGTCAPTSINTDSNSLILGGYYSTSYLFPGQIDDVQIFNYALTPLQVKSLFNQNSGVRFGPSTGSP